MVSLLKLLCCGRHLRPKDFNSDVLVPLRHGSVGLYTPGEVRPSM